jgi:hypothetical protein
MDLFCERGLSKRTSEAALSRPKTDLPLSADAVEKLGLVLATYLQPRKKVGAEYPVGH